jgi:hypothetical protein
MSRQRFLVLLCAALLVLAGALYLATQREQSQPTAGAALLPSLANELSTVSGLTLRKGSATPSVTLHKMGEQWTVAERADYPADVAKLRKLLLALRDARIVEEKTADPARFAAIGVEDPLDPAAAGAAVRAISFAESARTRPIVSSRPSASRPSRACGSMRGCSSCRRR